MSSITKKRPLPAVCVWGCVTVETACFILGSSEMCFPVMTSHLLI